MGGDHKCPVCQATFTRPQHVARHMRSHTGDRPYKCQYCGDQFARSDLLSRHVNKCHANEKPIASTGNRRKGSASASRATTSKQACDQCVQSSLPCDGCNPCAKCVQRKCRCTFVKFHRQTAPAGPGHNPRPSTSSAHGRQIYATQDDFVLGPAPTTIPTMADALYSSHTFAFPQLYPQDGISQDHNDYTTKYRAQADLIRDISTHHTSPTLYTDPRWTSQPWENSYPPGSHSEGSGASVAGAGAGQGLHSSADPSKDVSAHTALRLPYMSNNSPSTQTSMPLYINPRAHARRPSLDFSDGTSSTHSVPSSAASSSVHLPTDSHLPQQYNIHDLSEAYEPARQHHRLSQEGGVSSAFGLLSLDDPNVLAGLATDAAPFFSQTGLEMEMGGQASDDPNATPMPLKQDPSNQSTQLQPPALPTPSRDMDTREMREFWKAYMRTPLTGPSLDQAPPQGQTPQGSRSPATYRRPRVASLPSATTPQVERDRYLSSMQAPGQYPGTYGGPPANQNQLHPQNKGDGPTSSLRTTLHAEDLRSYEAAVLARKAPTTLNLQPRARRAARSSGAPSAGTSPQVTNMRFGGSGGDILPPKFFVPTPQEAQEQVQTRPGSAPHSGSIRPSPTPSSSSLANAFGQPQVRAQTGNHRVSFASASSRESSVDSAASEDSAGSPGFADAEDSKGEGLRPAFKRLPSQTLGPQYAKRAFRGYLSADETDNEREGSGDGSEDSDSRRAQPMTGVTSGGGVGIAGGIGGGGPTSRALGMSHPDRLVANLAARRRRMSAPGATSPTVATFAAAGASSRGEGEINGIASQ